MNPFAPTPEPEDWRARAECWVSGVPTDEFYPIKGGAGAGPNALAACSRCPVRRQCLAEVLGISSHDDFGMRAGTYPKDRVRLRRARANADRRAS